MSYSSKKNKKYDVFISFRGEDTRHGITSHIYDALVNKSIATYIDSNLKRGDDVWPALSEAIEASHISIVVFSENFATSKWCLTELVKVLECRKVNGQVVIPVFYNIDPSHIRYQTHSYEKAFAKHERNLETKNNASKKLKVLQWKAALTEAANISGWDNQTHKDEANLIHKVVNDVLQKLQLMYPNELEGVVRNEKNCELVESLVKKYQIVGIWGMPGIGKTTIAKILFAKQFAQYDYVCFANAKEYSRNRLLSELLKVEISPSDVAVSTFHMKRLRRSKVFIVLDNVESLDQFEYLCREYHGLNMDSRLIITTKDKQLLSGRADLIYEVKEWEDAKSLELFCKEAFVRSHPQKNYEHLLKKAIAYAGGVPLAVKVFALLLRAREIEFWESSFKKLDKHSNEELNKVLKLSYDNLDALQKKIFLDIAFFFIGEKKARVARILDACDFEASSGIVVLKDKALITISNNHTIQMHDLLQKMAWDIIHNDCGTDSATHTRLRGEAALEVIQENKGSSSIEGIMLDLSQANNFPLSADTFSKMKGLRILKFYAPSNQSCTNTYLNLPKFLEPFSNKLRYFEWNGYPFESLPQPFYAKFLAEIHMPHSKVKELWQETKELDKLEGIDLSECKQLEKLPNLSKASSLKWVNLSGCESLVDFQLSVLCPDKLVTLILDRCTKVREVRGEKHFNFLENISVDGCTSLKEFAVSSDLIENLDLSSTGIQTLDLSIGRLDKLKRLNLESLRLNHLPKGLSSVRSIRELKISGSTLVVEKQQLHELFDGLLSLQILHMKDFINQFELPDNIHILSKLMELNLDGSNMKRLPESIKKLEELEILSLVNCRELECIPELPPLITLLNAINCTSLVSVSSLKNLATKMMGKTKHISFSNNLKLDGHSLKLIMESLKLTMMSAVFQNVSVRRLSLSVHSYNYTGVDACQPGTSIPRLFECQTATDSSITITLLPDRSDLLGFIYSVVLSQAGGNGMKKGTARIKCQCNLGEEGIKVSWLNTYATELNRDHVYVWYDPFHFDSILKFYKHKICFEFCVTNDMGEVYGSIGIKACGVRLITVNEMERVLPELELDLEKKEELKKAVELESGYSITLKPIEKQKLSTIITQESVEEDNDNKIHYFNAEESTGSSNKEINTNVGISHEDNVTNSAKVFKSKGNEETQTESDTGLHQLSAVSAVVEENASNNKFKSKGNEETKTESDTGLHQLPVVSAVVEENASDNKFKSKGNEETQTESEAGLHQLPVVSAVVEENASDNKSIEKNWNFDWQDNFDETENPEETLHLQGGKTVVPDTNDLISEPEQENAPNMYLSRSDVDPFAELESIILGSPESSPKATDVAVKEALKNLECLLENSLESILSDVELQRQLYMSLECIKQASHEKVSPNVVKLVEKMTSTIENLFEDFVMTKKVVEDNINILQQKEKLVQIMRYAKKQQESKQNEKSQFEDEVKHLKEEGKKLDEKIRILVEQKKSIELKEIMSMESMERCEGEKKKMEDEAKNMIAEHKELMFSIKNSKSSYAAALSKQQKLKDKWEGFRIAFGEREPLVLLKWKTLIFLLLVSLGVIAYLVLFGMISITID